MFCGLSVKAGLSVGFGSLNVGCGEGIVVFCGLSVGARLSVGFGILNVGGGRVGRVCSVEISTFPCCSVPVPFSCVGVGTSADGLASFGGSVVVSSVKLHDVVAMAVSAKSIMASAVRIVVLSG